MRAPAQYVIRVVHGYVYDWKTGRTTCQRVWAERFTKAEAERVGKSLGGYYEVAKL